VAQSTPQEKKTQVRIPPIAFLGSDWNAVVNWRFSQKANVTYDRLFCTNLQLFGLKTPIPSPVFRRKYFYNNYIGRM
jgi:hypothetical protein